jgi:hypothetical protein
VAKYQQQNTVGTRLAMDAKKVLRDRVELPARKMILDRWSAVQLDLAAFARGVWAQHGAEQGPAFAAAARARIAAHSDAVLKAFRDEAVHILNVAKEQAYRVQTLLDHWILDQMTPASTPVKPKPGRVEGYQPVGRERRQIGRKAREAHVRAHARESWFDEPAEGTPNTDAGTPVASHEHLVDGYLKAWQAALIGGLTLSTVQGDTAEDVDARVMATRTDNRDVGEVFGRLISTEVQITVADADDDFDDEWGTLVTERVWMTMDDERVCPICASQEGRNEETATYDIPAHPVCRCWWRIVPKPYRDLLPEDARVAGAGDGSMVFRDPQTGEPAGQVVIEFHRWEQTVRS